jgi:hypothetical protein
MRVRPDDVGGGGGGCMARSFILVLAINIWRGGKVNLYQSLPLGLQRGRGGKGTSSLSEEEEDEEESSDDDEMESGADESEM